MKKEQQNRIAGGLDSLLNPTPNTAQAKAAKPQEPEEPKAKNVYKTVCYNLNPELIEAVKNIAYWDRKRANAVITEALERYVQEWEKRNGHDITPR